MENSGAYRVMYTLTVSGTYDASVVLGATGIVNRYYLCVITDKHSTHDDVRHCAFLAALFEYLVSQHGGGSRTVFLMAKASLWVCVHPLHP